MYLWSIFRGNSDIVLVCKVSHSQNKFCMCSQRHWNIVFFFSSNSYYYYYQFSITLRVLWANSKFLRGMQKPSVLPVNTLKKKKKIEIKPFFFLSHIFSVTVSASVLIRPSCKRFCQHEMRKFYSTSLLILLLICLVQ